MWETEVEWWRCVVIEVAERCNADERSTEEEMGRVGGDPFERRVGRCVRPCAWLVDWGCAYYRGGREGPSPFNYVTCHWLRPTSIPRGKSITAIPYTFDLVWPTLFKWFCKKSGRRLPCFHQHQLWCCINFELV